MLNFQQFFIYKLWQFSTGDPKKQKVIAGNGGHSAQDFIMGEPGTDKVLDVPPGVILQTDEGKIIAELNEVYIFFHFSY